MLTRVVEPSAWQKVRNIRLGLSLAIPITVLSSQSLRMILESSSEQPCPEGNMGFGADIRRSKLDPITNQVSDSLS